MSKYYKIKKENFDRMYKSAEENVINENEIMYMFDRGYKSALENMAYLFENEEKEVIKPTIQEKYLDLRKLYDKLDEEVLEFKISSDYNNIIEEALDVIQMTYNILYSRGIKMNDVEKGIEVHNEKLRLRGWKFKGEEK